MGFPDSAKGKEPTSHKRHHRGGHQEDTIRRPKRPRFDPWVEKIPWRAWRPTPVFLSVEFHEQRSLAGSIP